MFFLIVLYMNIFLSQGDMSIVRPLRNERLAFDYSVKEILN